jgi:hypothetical protein
MSNDEPNEPIKEEIRWVKGREEMSGKEEEEGEIRWVTSCVNKELYIMMTAMIIMDRTGCTAEEALQRILCPSTIRCLGDDAR